MRSTFLFCVLIVTSFSLAAQEYNQFDADGKRHGKWRKRYENSDQIRYEGTFDHGKEVGEFKFYKPSSGDSPTAIKTFSKDNDTVQIKYYTKKGKVISEGLMFKKDRIGMWTYYHNGSNKVMMTEEYKLGKLNGQQLTYFENGQLTEKTSFVDGKRQGERVMYSEKGTVLKEFKYDNDQLHGLTKYYDTDGNLIIEGNYKRDRKDGIWKYYENGRLIEQKSYPLQNRG
ncbi:toxin-antitoxin system YwqK family antitoxin [Aquimarina gracilis]|uniref:Toxin-antitoxin system YwqK family antitoxin n=1 Tax=Aquimarina gracilis TaxID=874422 RepID=A0ABU5ZQS5_9FLAO|nr:toxin-antitoxin system YwqK family antitoxin [Aquimarina gracilis]MEB3344425.1 toxin-antitoxin system YwqK family antitoxin [Aquimarina gracilis]